jgi:hypothetical protein
MCQGLLRVGSNLNGKIMNWKKFFVAFIAAWIFIFIFGWFFHAVLLKDAYAALPQGFQRSDADFKSHFGWLVAGQLVFAFVFTLIFASGFASGGVGAGIKLGIMLAFLGIGTHLIAYAVQPFPGNLMVYWSIGAIIEMIIVGAIVGAIYKPGTTQTPS